ncbi:AAA family ATPase [Azospirillum soli]|uniref:nucleotide-binding protein n=1 Tax=Azospirillum soli TaxID=1304799 RepID=UPI001AE6D14C|nr:nitrogenase iron protein NifH [Azospirillum soli]MBP2316502.1 nitrogenase iron protein NifH [Azospirillum soli]
MRHIAIYGKGGIGKSTLSSNLTAAIAEQGLTVMQIGCDPKADSTKNLTGGRKIASVLSLAEQYGIAKLELEQVVVQGFNNVYCVEAGGPEPGIGCAGRGVISVMDCLKELDVFNELKIDVVLYDVLGDVVCGGFAVPLRNGYADQVYEVTSGEMMALYAANNIARALNRFGQRGPVRLGGLICNQRNAFMEREAVESLARSLGTQVAAFVPRDNVVQECEMQGKTVIEGAPDSAQANVYRSVARTILSNERYSVPTPLTDDEFEELLVRVKAEGLAA